MLRHRNFPFSFELDISIVPPLAVRDSPDYKVIFNENLYEICYTPPPAC